MVVAKKYVYAKRFHGTPSDDNIRLEEETLPALKDGDVLFAAEYLTVDPYMRFFMDDLQMPLGITVIGEQVARVTESKHPDYKVGEHYAINTGWRTHSIVSIGKDDVRIKPVKDYGLPLSVSLGILGMPGATAYLATKNILDPKPGDTFFVNAAAGAVGSVVGQVAKLLAEERDRNTPDGRQTQAAVIPKCKVIGCAGTPKKVAWLKELGFDVVFNYKTEDYKEVLKQNAPSGVNCFFENVGGEFGNTVIREHMAQFGRVAVCGGISGYNDKEPVKSELPYKAMLMRSITVRGFIVGNDFPQDQWADAFDKMAQWIKQGKLQYKEHVTEGFENMRKAFYELFTGENNGKAIIKVSSLQSVKM